MPKSTSLRKTAAPDWFSNRPLAAQIARARPVAQQMLVEGIDACERQDDPFPNRVLALVDHRALTDLVDGFSDEQRAEFCDALEAARALGMALGLMLRGDAFGGGR